LKGTGSGSSVRKGGPAQRLRGSMEVTMRSAAVKIMFALFIAYTL
jgi:hypothetical protein